MKDDLKYQIITKRNVVRQYDNNITVDIKKKKLEDGLVMRIQR